MKPSAKGALLDAKGQKHERIIMLAPDIKRGFIPFNPTNMAYIDKAKDYNGG